MRADLPERCTPCEDRGETPLEGGLIAPRKVEDQAPQRATVEPILFQLERDRQPLK
jgi:hypothetical protein